MVWGSGLRVWAIVSRGLMYRLVFTKGVGFVFGVGQQENVFTRPAGIVVRENIAANVHRFSFVHVKEYFVAAKAADVLCCN